MPPNPIGPLVAKITHVSAVMRLQQEIFGLAEDFWKDGPENLFKLDLHWKMPIKKRRHADEAVATAPVPAAQPTRLTSKLWHAQPGEISERMWGDGFVTPGGATVTAMLIKPLGLTKEMSVLDLSAGLGGRMRRTSEETGAYITGLEPDAAIAARGMELSVKAGKGKRAAISHYDPAKLTLDRAYDCIIARETFYRVADRAAFFATISKHTKPQAQIAYTDYIVDNEHREHPAILAWKKNEPLANPTGLVETAEEWAKVGFSLRVHEDLSAYYKAEVMKGMKRLVDFLAAGNKPDGATGLVVVRRIAIWKYRIDAMNNGMKFYRFYGTKQ